MSLRYVIVVLVLLLAGCAGWAVGSQAPVAAAVATPAGRIVGWVFADANGNRIRDTGETLISGAMVAAQLGESVLTQVTVDGWFGFSGVADGQWQVTATVAGYSCELHSATVAAGSKATVNVSCQRSLPTITPTATMTPLPPTPTATAPAATAPAAMTPAVGLASQVCPDATPICVQVWLGMGAGSQWWPVCPEGRSQVSRFCLTTMGQWVSLP